MKKKLKDFSQVEIDTICDKHPLCLNCPFSSNDKWDIWGCYALNDEVWEDLEIEYDEKEIL